jgi:hypothetical protein
VSDAYTEKLDAILAALGSLSERIANVEQILQITTTAPVPGQPAQIVGPLAAFVRPPANAVPYGYLTEMTEPDVAEAIKRALHCVTWRGEFGVAEQDINSRWEVIERLKIADPAILPHYVFLDPEFAGYALLTGLIQPHTQDALSFGATAEQRRGYAGTTVQSFLDSQFASSDGGPGIA